MQSTVPAEPSGRLIALTSSTRSTPGPGPHVAADVGLAGEERPQVGVIDLALDLVRAELEDRPGAVERLGDELAERLVMVAHRGAPP